MEGGPNIQEADYSSSSTSNENEEKTCAYSCCHPCGKCHRFIALIFMCFLGFGSYFCYDSPAALQNHFTHDLNVTTTQFVLFYSLYSWPNVVLCFIGGFLIDRVFGIGLGTNIYMFITLMGQIFFAFGALFNILWMMMLGRFIFGIGGESLAVAQNNYAVLWFKGKELNMVFGLQLSLARLGSTVNFWVMEPIYQWVQVTFQGYEGLGIALFIAGISCIFSMICALVLGYLDKRAERILRRNIDTAVEIVRITDVKDFSCIFWLISIICVAYYVTIFPFIALGEKFFIQRFNLEPQKANTVNSIVYLISAFASPLLGFLIDKCGKNIFWILLSILFTACAHSLLIFTYVNPYVGMVIMGLAYSMLASGLWPLVALTIPEYQLGTAYGICQAVQNLGLAVISIVAGIIVEKCGYFWLEMFFLGSLAVAFLSTLLIWIMDMSYNGTLNMTPKQREEHQLLRVVGDSERLLHEEGTSSGEMLPSSDFQIRNRYLCRIGAPLPSNFKSSIYRRFR